MKSQIVRLLILCIMMLYADNMAAQVDPVLAGTVATGDALITEQLKKTNKEQLSIVGINTGIYYNTEKIKKYEETTYKYLSEAQSIIQNSFDIVKCGELLESITSNLAKCSSAAYNHPQGAIVSLIVSKQYSRIVKESTSLYSYVASLVTKGGEKNLLNSAERNLILTEVTSRLSSINRSLMSLRYQIQYLRWMDIPRYLAPNAYYKFVSSELIVSRIKRDIDRLSK